MTESITLDPAAEQQRATLKQFRDAFRKLARERKITSADIIAYNVMRGLPTDRGFSPITNTNKLDNGADPWLGKQQAFARLSWLTNDRNKTSFIERFKPSLTEDGIKALRSAL